MKTQDGVELPPEAADRLLQKVRAPLRGLRRSSLLTFASHCGHVPGLTLRPATNPYAPQ